MSTAPFPTIKVVLPTPAEEAPWGDRQPLPALTPPVPSLPPDLLPPALRPWLFDIADRVSVPLEFPSVAAFVALGSVVGRAVAIRPMRRDDWTIPANLWGGIVGPPGTLKSPALEAALKPLGRLVARARDEFEALRARQLAELEAVEARKRATKSSMEKAAKTGDGAKLAALTRDFQRIAEEEAAAAKTERRYTTSDATIEKIGMLLNENPRGLLVVRDELMGWLRGLDRDDRAQDRAFYLEAWNGTGPFTVDRVVRGTLHIEALCLSIVGGIQPGKLSTYVRGAVAGEDEADGLVQRIQLLVWPDEFGEWRGVDRWPDSASRDRAFRIFERLAAIDGAALGAETENGSLPFLRFAPDAQGLFLDWRLDLEKRLSSEEIRNAPAFAAHMAKYRSLFGKLALVSHLVAVADGAPAGPVSLEAAQLAAMWTEYLEAHARKVYAAELAGDRAAAVALAEKIRGGKVADGMAVRSIAERDWSGLRTAGSVFAGAEILEGLGWLRVEETTPGDKGGRPSAFVRLHPTLRKPAPGGIAA
jgi:putative DNA primase/helicase